jgi:hypothetical protein
LERCVKTLQKVWVLKIGIGAQVMAKERWVLLTQ